ncbi:MAG: hypothetical protein Ct9H300mP24_7460 [Candidatus Neomarinimicrobiota bacterium]|nr:MAG: hypothetical protein Ct9H300mP24_7460 [Candidatus Neomarinimicrobiota bacterium]
MALPACKKAIKNAGIKPRFGCYYCGTVSSDYNFPGWPQIIQQKLGITTILVLLILVQHVLRLYIC